MQLPVLRIELEGVKQNIAHMFSKNNDELNKMVQETIASQLTEEWVQGEINQAVRDCMKSAIEDIANNWKLKNAITELMVDYIEKIISKDS